MRVFCHGVIPVALKFYFHVTNQSFHAAHVSVELHKLSFPAFPAALDIGYTLTLEIQRDAFCLLRDAQLSHICHLQQSKKHNFYIFGGIMGSISFGLNSIAV